LSLADIASAVDIASKSSSDSGLFTKAALQFSKEHGLLGILLHQLETIVLPPRPPNAGSILTQTVYIRTTTGWRGLDQFPSETGAKPSGAFMRDLSNFEMGFVPLESIRERFFPYFEPAPHWENFPVPFSPDFWNQYTEPLIEFWNMALQFQHAVEAARFQPRRPNEWGLFQSGLDGLNVLTAPMTSNLYPERRAEAISRRRGRSSVTRMVKPTLGWVTHSLVASFAEQAKLDLAQFRLLRCLKCGAYFVTKAKMAKYCTAKCRNTVQVRKYRKNLKKRKIQEEREAK
jgi:hypothetical protein